METTQRWNWATCKSRKKCPNPEFQLKTEYELTCCWPLWKICALSTSKGGFLVMVALKSRYGSHTLTRNALNGPIHACGASKGRWVGLCVENSSCVPSGLSYKRRSWNENATKIRVSNISLWMMLLDEVLIIKVPCWQCMWVIKAGTFQLDEYGKKEL